MPRAITECRIFSKQQIEEILKQTAKLSIISAFYIHQQTVKWGDDGECIVLTEHRPSDEMTSKT